MAATQVPPVTELLHPVLSALLSIGGSGTIEEIDAGAAEAARLSEGQLAVLHGDGPKTKANYRFAWARSYLKAIGALDNSERGVWTVTESGRTMQKSEIDSSIAAYLLRLRKDRRARRDPALILPGADGEEATTTKRTPRQIGRSSCSRFSSRLLPTHSSGSLSGC